eukprot:COSAG02_NODE_35772_length_463_cov_2.934066_1_plen_75_part_10
MTSRFRIWILIGFAPEKCPLAAIKCHRHHTALNQASRGKGNMGEFIISGHRILHENSEFSAFLHGGDSPAICHDS